MRDWKPAAKAWVRDGSQRNAAPYSVRSPRRPPSASAIIRPRSVLTWTYTLSSFSLPSSVSIIPFAPESRVERERVAHLEGRSEVEHSSRGEIAELRTAMPPGLALLLGHECLEAKVERASECIPCAGIDAIFRVGSPGSEVKDTEVLRQ